MHKERGLEELPISRTIIYDPHRDIIEIRELVLFISQESLPLPHCSQPFENMPQLGTRATNTSMFFDEKAKLSSHRGVWIPTHVAGQHFSLVPDYSKNGNIGQHNLL